VPSGPGLKPPLEGLIKIFGRFFRDERQPEAKAFLDITNAMNVRNQYAKRRSVKWAVACLVVRCVRSVNCVRCLTFVALRGNTALLLSSTIIFASC